MAALATLKRKRGVTLGESVRAALSARLMAGEFAPGDKFSLRSLAETLGVSMTPVREAVNRLVADNALEVTPNRALRVRVLDVAKFRELTALRIDIEGRAAFRAAAARDDADLEAMIRFEKALRAEALSDRPNLANATLANQQLHFAIYRAAKSPMLVDVIAGLWLKAGPVLNLDMRSSRARLKSAHTLRVHEAAVSAVRARDGAKAQAAITEDIRTAAEFIISRGLLPA